MGCTAIHLRVFIDFWHSKLVSSQIVFLLFHFHNTKYIMRRSGMQTLFKPDFSSQWTQNPFVGSPQLEKMLSKSANSLRKYVFYQSKGRWLHRNIDNFLKAIKLLQSPRIQNTNDSQSNSMKYFDEKEENKTEKRNQKLVIILPWKGTPDSSHLLYIFIVSLNFQCWQKAVKVKIHAYFLIAVQICNNEWQSENL